MCVFSMCDSERERERQIPRQKEKANELVTVKRETLEKDETKKFICSFEPNMRPRVRFYVWSEENGVRRRKVDVRGRRRRRRRKGQFSEDKKPEQIDLS